MMEQKPGDQRPLESDPDGVRVVAAPGAGGARRSIYQALALFFAASCVGYVLMPRPTPALRAGEDTDRVRPPQTHHTLSAAPATPSSDADAAAAASVGSPSQGTAPVASTRPLTPRRAASKRPGDAPEEPTDPPLIAPGGREITGKEYIQALHDAGIYEGIGAFNPPGTSPPLEGLAVPEDYQLPEGYVRHYQSTDDGQDIEPILMYSPDYEFLGEEGNPIPIPEDRVVPPEHAPPGFPIRKIEIPPERAPGDLSR